MKKNLVIITLAVIVSVMGSVYYLNNRPANHREQLLRVPEHAYNEWIEKYGDSTDSLQTYSIKLLVEVVNQNSRKLGILEDPNE